MLSVRDLTQRFGDATVVEGLSFDVAVGEIVALVGVNGAGKTTTLRAIVGFDERADGDVLLHGEPLDERNSETRRKVCALLDDGAWFPDLTVAEHLMVYAVAHGQAADSAISALDDLGISALADRLPSTLSSGQTQRAKLAQALVRPWDLLILDEPEQRLDDDGRAWLGQYLLAQANAGHAVLMASHDARLREACAARVVYITAAG